MTDTDLDIHSTKFYQSGAVDIGCSTWCIVQSQNEQEHQNNSFWVSSVVLHHFATVSTQYKYKKEDTSWTAWIFIIQYFPFIAVIQSPIVPMTVGALDMCSSVMATLGSLDHRFPWGSQFFKTGGTYTSHCWPLFTCNSDLLIPSWGLNGSYSSPSLVGEPWGLLPLLVALWEGPTLTSFVIGDFKPFPTATSCGIPCFWLDGLSFWHGPLCTQPNLAPVLTPAWLLPFGRG